MGIVINTDLNSLALPESDLKWLNFVEKFDELLKANSNYKPLRRTVFEMVINDSVSANHSSNLRKYLSKSKSTILRTLNRINLKKCDIIIWQDIDRVYMWETINRLQSLVKDSKQYSTVFVKPSLNHTQLHSTPIPVYPKFQKKVSSNALKFTELIISSFKRDNCEQLILNLNNSFLEYEAYLEYFQYICKLVKPKLLFFTNDQYLPSAAFAFVAKQSKIKTFVIQHGATNPFQYPLQANKLLAWGKKDVAYFRNIGIPENSIVLIGSILHDEFCFLENNRVDKNKILLLSNGNNEERNGVLPQKAYEWLDKLKSDCGEKNEYYVRFHPSEMKKYRDYGRKFDLTLNHVSIAKAIELSDIIIGYVSTSLLESALSGRPVIQILSEGNPNLCRYHEDGIALGVHDYSDFKSIVEKLSFNVEYYRATSKSQNNHVKNYFCYHPVAGNKLKNEVISDICS